jgi:hypothetical protein
MTKNVYVRNPETGEEGWYGPDHASSELPSWANDLVTNEGVFEEVPDEGTPPNPPSSQTVVGEPEEFGARKPSTRTVTANDPFAGNGGEVKRPAKSANKAEWVSFAVNQGGLALEDAEALTRDELVERFGG